MSQQGLVQKKEGEKRDKEREGHVLPAASREPHDLKIKVRMIKRKIQIPLRIFQGKNLILLTQNTFFSSGCSLILSVIFQHVTMH